MVCWLHGFLNLNEVDSKFSLIPRGNGRKWYLYMAADALMTWRPRLRAVLISRSHYSPSLAHTRSIHSPSLPLFTDSYSFLMVRVEMCAITRAVSPVMAFHKSSRIHNSLRLSKPPWQFYGCASVFRLFDFGKVVF